MWTKIKQFLNSKVYMPMWVYCLLWSMFGSVVSTVGIRFYTWLTKIIGV